MKRKTDSQDKPEHLKKILSNLIEELKERSDDYTTKPIHEIFDDDVRSQLWMNCLDYVEQTPDDQRYKVVREIVRMDKVRLIMGPAGKSN